MRAGSAIAAGALLALASPTFAPAFAQVTVNPGALDALPSRPAPAARPATRPKPPARPATKPAPSAPAAAARKPAKPEKPAIPVAPPAIANLPPPVAVPVAPAPPPPPIPVVADAPGTASAITHGLRLTFGSDRTDLNPATETALRTLARTAKSQDVPVNVYAYASGSADDPSTPRRLSLARALAARAVLMAEGIPSARIYPRALGPAGGATDPDRVDVVTGPPGPPPNPPPNPPPGVATP